MIVGDELRLIGLAGLAMSGKDTAADILVAGKGFKKLSMAYPLRLETDLAVWTRTLPEWSEEWSVEMPDDIVRIIYDGVIDVWDKPTSADARTMLQWWGTEYRRQLFKDSYWVDLVKMRVQRFLDFGTPVVISDIRFANEAQMIKDLGGQVWKIERDNNTGVGKTHASEKFVDSDWPWDMVVGNNGNVEQLKLAVLDLYNCEIQIARCHREILENPNCPINIQRFGGWADWQTERAIILDEAKA